MSDVSHNQSLLSLVYSQLVATPDTKRDIWIEMYECMETYRRNRTSEMANLKSLTKHMQKMKGQLMCAKNRGIQRRLHKQIADCRKIIEQIVRTVQRMMDGLERSIKVFESRVLDTQTQLENLFANFKQQNIRHVGAEAILESFRKNNGVIFPEIAIFLAEHREHLNDWKE